MKELNLIHVILRYYHSLRFVFVRHVNICLVLTFFFVSINKIMIYHMWVCDYVVELKYSFLAFVSSCVMLLLHPLFLLTFVSFFMIFFPIYMSISKVKTTLTMILSIKQLTYCRQINKWNKIINRQRYHRKKT